MKKRLLSLIIASCFITARAAEPYSNQTDKIKKLFNSLFNKDRDYNETADLNGIELSNFTPIIKEEKIDITEHKEALPLENLDNNNNKNNDSDSQEVTTINSNNTVDQKEDPVMSPLEMVENNRIDTTDNAQPIIIEIEQDKTQDVLDTKENNNTGLVIVKEEVLLQEDKKQEVITNQSNIIENTSEIKEKSENNQTNIINENSPVDSKTTVAQSSYYKYAPHAGIGIVMTTIVAATIYYYKQPIVNRLSSLKTRIVSYFKA